MTRTFSSFPLGLLKANNICINANTSESLKTCLESDQTQIERGNCYNLSAKSKESSTRSNRTPFRALNVPFSFTAQDPLINQYLSIRHTKMQEQFTKGKTSNRINCENIKISENLSRDLQKQK